MYDQDDMYGEFRQRNPMASASIALGVASLLSCPTFYIAFPCGALAIICAILSRGRFKLTGKGKAGIICGIIGMILSAVITATAVHTVLTNPLMKARLEQTLQMYLGDSSFDLDEMLDSLFPAPSIFGSGDGGAASSTDETEEETEKRVRLRVAEDQDTAGGISEDSTEAAAENSAADTPSEKESSESDTDPGEGSIPDESQDNDSQSPSDKSPVTIPEGGGSFI